MQNEISIINNIDESNIDDSVIINLKDNINEISSIMKIHDSILNDSVVNYFNKSIKINSNNKSKEIRLKDRNSKELALLIKKLLPSLTNKLISRNIKMSNSVLIELLELLSLNKISYDINIPNSVVNKSKFDYDFVARITFEVNVNNVVKMNYNCLIKFYIEKHEPKVEFSILLFEAFAFNNYILKLKKEIDIASDLYCLDYVDKAKNDIMNYLNSI